MTEFLRKWLTERPVLAVTVLFLAITLPGLGGGYLWDRDETWYASCALNMLETGDWLTPAVGERMFFEKPPLAYWTIAVAFRFLGLSEFAARLPSAVFGLGTVLITFVLGAFAGGRRLGLIAAGVLATTLHFGVMSRMAMTDPGLIFGMAGGLAAFWRMEESRDRPTSYALWCLLGGVSVGIAVLSKGPLGLLPGVIALVYLAARRDFTFLLRANWRLLIGLTSIVAIAAPWYILVRQAHGEQFVEEFFVDQNLNRFGAAIQGHTGPFYYYLPTFLVGLMPWTFVLLTAPFRRRPMDRFDLFLWSWVLVPFAMFSAMATKLPHYVAPSFPALAILVAREIEWRLEEERPCPRLLAAGFWIMSIAGLAVAATGLLSLWVFEDFPVAALLVPGVVAAAGFSFAAWQFWKGRGLSRAFLANGVAMALFFFSVMTVSLPRMEQTQALTQAIFDSMDLARQDDGEVGSDELFAFARFEPSLFYYSRGMMNVGREEELHAFFESVPAGETVFVLARPNHVDNVEREMPRGFTYRVRAYDELVPKRESLNELLDPTMMLLHTRLIEATRGQPEDQ